MAQPTNPLIIWAEDNVNLPVTGRPNKDAPQESLRKTGWDEGQKPSCEEFNYILNNLAQYIKYYGTEKTQEFLTKAANLSDLTDVVAARNNLSVYSQAQVNAKQINTGVGLTGGGDLSSNRTISLSSVSSCISVLTGTISNGGTIPLPSGFSESQCKWMVSVNDDNANNTQWDIAELNLISTPYRLQCSTVGRVVTIKSTVFADTGAGNTGTYVVHDGTANYIVIGVK